MSQEIEMTKTYVTFEFEVPKFHWSGRPLSRLEQVAPYLNEWVTDLKIHTECCRANVEKFLGPKEEDMEFEINLAEKMGSEEIRKAILEGERLAEEHRIKFEAEKEKECQDLYGCSWSLFRSLKWGEQQELRKKHGVHWANGKWEKAL